MQDLDKRVLRFQQIRAREKARAIVRAKIRCQVQSIAPTATPKQVEQIIDGHLKLVAGEVIVASGRNVKVFRK